MHCLLVRRVACRAACRPRVTGGQRASCPMSATRSPSHLARGISVVIPTYRRPDALLECLAGISAQSPLPTEVICVVREDDSATRSALCRWQGALAIRVVAPAGPGLVAALGAGAHAARTELIAFVDDDAVPRARWLERISSHFASDPNVAAVGGRDYVNHARNRELSDRSLTPAERHPRRVGVVEWTGRVTAGHHLGTGLPRDADVLKGANMAFRTQSLLDVGFDPLIRGEASQVHNEAWPCLALRRRGERIVYDPAVAVDHNVRA